MTTFTQGETVTAKVSMQKMIQGAKYTVQQAIRGSFGIVTYELTPVNGGESILVNNGHILLTK